MSEIIKEIKKPELITINYRDLLQKELPPRENLLNPWLPKAGLCMIYAQRGIGKTFFALEIALAVAYGDQFLSFNAPKPVRVLYIDGEMPANTMQERLAQIEKRKASSSNMIEPVFIMDGLQTESMPDLSTPEGQKMIEPHLGNADLIIIDNISCLCRSGKENESESWITIQDWALQQRRKGKSVLFIHHAGKSGNQRGTSKREDILDTVINLKRPNDYEPSQGARFEIHFEKSRNMLGEDTKPLICQLTDGGWEYHHLEASNYKRVVELLKEGYSQKEITDELGLSKGQVSKLAKQARESGDAHESK